MICKCGSQKFGHFDDYGVEYDYCIVCNTMYDEDGNELQEGDLPEPEYDPDNPDHERDIREGEE